MLKWLRLFCFAQLAVIKVGLIRITVAGIADFGLGPGSCFIVLEDSGEVF